MSGLAAIALLILTALLEVATPALRSRRLPARRPGDGAALRLRRRFAAAPAKAPAPKQQDREYQPGRQREGGLVHEVLREQVGHEQKARQDRHGKRGEAGADHREQSPLETLDRRQ